MASEGILREFVLLNGESCARIQCSPSLIPAPGQYLLAYADASDLPLATPIFQAKSFGDGFLAASPLPASWTLGIRLSMRGPNGHGFHLPDRARRVALVAWKDSPLHLFGLLDLGLKQEAAIVLVCRTPPEDLPLQVEVQPLNALVEVCRWADYVALDSTRESLPELKKMPGMDHTLKIPNEAQILIRAPMPCGALAECGVCTIEGRRGHWLACKDGPVFDLRDILD